MALIYKPNALYMSPKNESVDVTDDIKFSFMFKGYQLLSATGQIYQNSNIGEWQEISGATFNFDNANAPYYNNDVLSTTLSSGTAYTSIVNNVNSTLGWGVTVYGVSSTQNATSVNNDTFLIPAQKGFETGDMVNVTGTGIPYTFISFYDSKLSLGAVTSDTTAGDNIFAVSEVVYLNLTTGDKIQAITDTPPYYSNTAYYIRKLNEGASDPTGYFIAVYSTKAAAESGTGTRVTSVANTTFYVNPVFSSSSVFYVGLIGGNKIKLYTSKEAALQGVAEAVVPLTNNSSYTIQVFEKSQVVQFAPVILNTIVFDLDNVYDNNGHGKVDLVLTSTGQADNSYAYNFVDNNNTYDLFNGQQLTISVDGDDVVCYLRLFDNNNKMQLYSTRAAAEYGDSTYLRAFAISPLNAYLSEVLTIKKDFVVSWLDVSNIPLILSWKAYLYGYDVDKDGKTKTTLIEESPIQYTGNVHYQFKHMLISFNQYKIVFILTDNNGYVYNGSLIFDVGYKSLTESYTPNVFANNCDSSINIDWRNALAIVGQTTGNISYTANNYLINGNYGTVIPTASAIRYDVDIPRSNIPTFLFKPNTNTFSGTIFTLDGQKQKVSLSYSNSNHRFALTIINKNLGNTESVYLVDTDVTTLSMNEVYLIGYTSSGIYIRKYKDV